MAAKIAKTRWAKLSMSILVLSVSIVLDQRSDEDRIRNCYLKRLQLRLDFLRMREVVELYSILDQYLGVSNEWSLTSISPCPAGLGMPEACQGCINQGQGDLFPWRRACVLSQAM